MDTNYDDPESYSYPLVGEHSKENNTQKKHDVCIDQVGFSGSYWQKVFQIMSGISSHFSLDPIEKNKDVSAGVSATLQVHWWIIIFHHIPIYSPLDCHKFG